MNETEFNALADETLSRIEVALDRCGVDLDCSQVGDGVLEIETDGGGKIIVNRHAANREIWVAARSGGFHFQWSGGAWLDSRGQGELMAVLSLLVSEATGERISLG